MNIHRNAIIPLIFFTCFLVLLFVSCKQKSLDGKLIITQVPKGRVELNTITGENWRYRTGASIVMIDPRKPASVNMLTKDFYSACSPDISWDGTLMLFAAQLKKDDPWQIWEMDLKKMTSRKITSFKENCTDPVFLPTGRVAFSKYNTDSLSIIGHALFTCNSDGADSKQITFHPHANFATMIMRDGRLLTISRQVFPHQMEQMYMVVRPDGTKADMFYEGNKGCSIVTKARETSDGKIYFIETDSLDNSDVVYITYNRPLHTRINLTSMVEGNYCTVCPMESDKLMVSYQNSKNEPFGLYEFDVAGKKLGKQIYGDENIDIIDAIRITSSERPKKLPSEVDMGVKTGLVLCQDINFTGLGLSHEAALLKKAQMIEVLGIDTTFGIVQVEKDGSFYLKVLADQPFRIQTLDENGRVVNGPCAWIWLRPNERRGCIGCHENRELAPENNVPLSVKLDPVAIPVYTSEVGEKEVELE